MKYDKEVVKLLHQPCNVREVVGLIESREKVSQEIAAADPTGEKRKAQWSNATTQEVSSAIIERVNVDVLANNWAMGFFELVTLGPTDWPYIITSQRDTNYNITFVGADGGLRKKQRVQAVTKQMLEMRLIASPVVEYPYFDLQTGFWDYAADAMAELSYEFNRAIDREARTILDASDVAAGLLSDLNLHPDIVTAGLPTKNYYDLSGVDVAGKWSLAKFKEIFKYADAWSSDVEQDGTPLRVQAIYMNPERKTDTWDWVDLVAGYAIGGSGVADPAKTIPTSTRQAIWQSGELTSMYGHSFALVGRNTLAADEAWVQFNKPCGKLYVKPAFDVIERDTSLQIHAKNREAVRMQKAMTMVVPSNRRRYFMKIKL